MRRFVLLFLPVVALLASGVTTPARAAASTSVVVWAGSLMPGTELHGVIVPANGTAKRLVVKAADRKTGKVTVAGKLSLTSEQRFDILSSAAGAMSEPGVTAANGPEHGSYASATILGNGKTRTVLGLNAAPPLLSSLLVAVNKAVPAVLRLRDPTSGVVKAAAGPTTAPCTPGRSPTTIAKQISLKDAAAAGIATLTAKGGPSGDVVAVDASFKPIAGPVTVKVNLEVSSYPGGPTAADVKAAIEGNLAGRQADNGTPLMFDVNVRARAPGSPPTPCFHQVELVKDADYRGEVSTSGIDLTTTPGSGQWPSGRGAVGDRQIWTHETLHLAGLDDRFSSVFQVGAKQYPIPDQVDISDKVALAQWAKSQKLDPKSGVAGTKAKPGFEQDIMGDVFKGTEKLSQADVDTFVAIGSERLDITSDPGDVLVNKDGSEQSLAVGTDFELNVQEGKTSHVDGLVAYCIDHHRGIPDSGEQFDVLGRAGDQPEGGMQALQRVLEVVARRQDGPLSETPGAQGAVWRVTEDEAPNSADAEDILAAAGVPPGAVFASPHFQDPNAGAPGSAAITRTGIIPPPPPPPPGSVQRGPLPAVRVTKLAVSPRSVAPGKEAIVTATITVAGAPGSVTLRLQSERKGKTETVKAYRPRHLTEGANLVSVLVPSLKPGSYRLLATGTFAAKRASLIVRR
jgi:hypothetical protein